jgi:xanthine phosphoribosyltransferase
MPTELPLTWQELHSTAKHLSAALRGKGPVDGTWTTLIAVTRGGLVPACLVARDLDIRTIETISISSYDHQAQGSVSVLKAAAGVGDGTGCLIVDDLADTGTTLKMIREMTQDSLVVTIFAKPAGESLVDLFREKVAQNVWVRFPWDTEKGSRFVQPLARRSPQP